MHRDGHTALLSRASHAHPAHRRLGAPGERTRAIASVATGTIRTPSLQVCECTRASPCNDTAATNTPLSAPRLPRVQLQGQPRSQNPAWEFPKINDSHISPAARSSPGCEPRCPHRTSQYSERARDHTPSTFATNTVLTDQSHRYCRSSLPAPALESEPHHRTGRAGGNTVYTRFGSTRGFRPPLGPGRDDARACRHTSPTACTQTHKDPAGALTMCCAFQFRASPPAQHALPVPPVLGHGASRATALPR